MKTPGRASSDDPICASPRCGLPLSDPVHSAGRASSCEREKYRTPPEPCKYGNDVCPPCQRRWSDEENAHGRASSPHEWWRCHCRGLAGQGHEDEHAVCNQQHDGKPCGEVITIKDAPASPLSFGVDHD